ncbi:MAG: metal ABC transporter permease [Promethearchaeota archaeon]
MANPFEIVQYWFFQKALLISLLAAIPCAIIGTFIVVKRISMISGSISHATFGGLGISYFLGFNPLMGATIFGVLCGSLIGILQNRAKKRLDTILSFLWAFGMAIGLIFLYLTPGYASDLFTYLFGNLFLITDGDLLIVLILNVVIIVALVFTYQTLKVVLFNDEFAQVRNIPNFWVYQIFYILVSLTIIVILSVVGVILLIAFLTLPAAIALFYQKNMKKVMLWSGIIVLFSNILGLFLAHWIELPPGPVIVVILAFLYLVSFVYDYAKKFIEKKKNKIESHACDIELESFGIFQESIKDYSNHHDHEHYQTPPKSDKEGT